MKTLRERYKRYFEEAWWDSYVDTNYCSEGIVLVCHGVEGVDAAHECDINDLLERGVREQCRKSS